MCIGKTTVRHAFSLNFLVDGAAFTLNLRFDALSHQRDLQGKEVSVSDAIAQRFD
jgi:hypothetical protein